MAFKSRFLFVNDDGDYEEGMSGGVFITNVQPQNGSDVVDITWQSGIVGSSLVESIETDTEEIIVTVEWDGTAYNWSGGVEVNGVAVTGISEIENSRRFTGTVNIDLNGDLDIIAIHDDGAVHSVPVTLQGVGPEITTVVFINGYPGTQTEVKENDMFDIEVHFEPSGSEPSHVEVYNYGACKSGTFDLSGTELNWGSVHKATITITIDATSTSVQALSGRVRARNSFGTFGADGNTDDGGTSDGTNLVNCNDRHPSVSWGTISYPASQEALKGSETADVAFNYSFTDSVVFNSPNGDLSVYNDTLLESIKTVTRIAGTYNISTSNLRASAHRDANNTDTVASAIVRIADALPTITVNESAVRFQKGGNSGTSAQNHTVTISSNQQLISNPILVAPEGTLGTFSGGTSIYNATITIHDNDTNGVYTWQSLVAINLANQTQNVISGNDTYEIGGFVERDIYFSAQSLEEALGTSVSDTTKLVAVDKDLIDMTFYADLDDHVRGYSITEPTMTYNATGNILFWNDVTDRENNTTGLSFIRIREDV